MLHQLSLMSSFNVFCSSSFLKQKRFNARLILVPIEAFECENSGRNTPQKTYILFPL